MTESAVDAVRGPASDNKSFNRVLAALATLSTGWTIYGTSSNVNQFLSLEEVFRSTKVMLPGLTVLAIEQQQALAAVMFTLCAVCLYETYRRGEKRRTSYLNLGGILVPLLWWILQTTSFFITESVILRFRFR
jgi:hypothetical protein